MNYQISSGRETDVESIFFFLTKTGLTSFTHIRYIFTNNINMFLETIISVAGRLNVIEIKLNK